MEIAFNAPLAPSTPPAIVGLGRLLPKKISDLLRKSLKTKIMPKWVSYRKKNVLCKVLTITMPRRWDLEHHDQCRGKSFRIVLSLLWGTTAKLFRKLFWSCSEDVRRFIEAVLKRIENCLIDYFDIVGDLFRSCSAKRSEKVLKHCTLMNFVSNMPNSPGALWEPSW